MTEVHKTKWFLPLFSVALGLFFLGALWAGGERREGVEALGVMSALGPVFLVGGRSDLVRGLRGDGRDEYWQRMDVHVQLGSIADVAYILSFGFLRWRG